MDRTLPVLVMLVACQPAKAPQPAPTASVVKTDTVLLCRESPDANKARVAELAAAGWRYVGPLHNDGINCTVTLWQCSDARSSCANGK